MSTTFFSRRVNPRTACLLTALALLSGCGNANDAPAASDNEASTVASDAAKGRAVFVEKGCVICHSVNGVGGKAATPLDATDAIQRDGLAGFAARMWRGAPAMVELQSLELGYTIWLESEDITNLAAFAEDRSEQKKLVIDDVPEESRDAFLSEGFWEAEDWREFLEDGQEGFETPETTDGQ